MSPVPAGAGREAPPGIGARRQPRRQRVAGQQRPGGLLEAKLEIPRPGFRVLPRARLTRLLEDATRHRVTLLSAPPGSGKTIACALWAQNHQSNPRSGWLSVDRADNDPARFRSYLLAALRRAEVSPPAVFSDAEASPLEDFPLLLAEAAGQFTEPVVLVLDDVHELTGDVVVGWLDKLMRYAPPRLVFVLSGRRAPQLRLARLRLSGDLADIGAGALACTRDEADAYFRMHGVQPSPADLDELLRHTEGWMAGLRLAALRTQARPAGHGIAGIAGDDPIVSDYLRDEILAGHDARTRAFLLRTSIVRELTGDLADAVTNTAGSAWFLDRLNRQNILAGNFDGTRAWYRHQPLLRELLLAELRREMPEEIPVLLRRATRWYAQQEMPVEALRSSIGAGDLNLAAQVLADSDIRILMERGPAELDQVLSPVPADSAAAYPAFGAAWAASRLWSDDPGGAQAHLKAAENAIGRAGRRMRPVVESKLTALRVMQASGMPDASPDVLTRASSDAEEMARGACAPAGHNALGLLWWAIAVAHLHRSDLPRASHALRLAERQLYAGGFPALRARARAWWAVCQAGQGKLTDAARVAAEALNADGPGALATRNIARLALAIVNLMRDQPAAACRLLDEINCQGHACLPGEPPVATPAMVIRTRALIGRSDIVAARAALSQLEEVAGRSAPAAAGPITSLQGELALRSGDKDLRREVIAKLTSGASPVTPGGHLILSWLCIAESDPDRALTAAESCVAVCDDGAKLHERISALLAAAVAHRRLKDTQRATDLLEQALLLAEPEEMYRPFLDGGTAARSVLTVLVTPTSRSAGFARKLLQRFDAQPPVPPAALDGGIPALSGTELTVLRFLPSHLTNQEIGEALCVSLNTVKTHLRSIYRKLGARSRREAITLARHHNLITLTRCQQIPRWPAASGPRTCCAPRCCTASRCRERHPASGSAPPPAPDLCWPRCTAPSNTRAPAPSSARSANIWTMSTTRAVSGLAVMSPKPTVVKTVTLKYRVSVRVSGWVKLAAEARSIRKYVEANSSR